MNETTTTQAEEAHEVDSSLQNPSEDSLHALSSPDCEEALPPLPSAQTVEALQSQIVQLQQKLSEKESEAQKTLTELSEFYRLFPNASATELPESVERDVRSGIPLSAAYALYEKRTAHHREFADGINRRNASLSPGGVGEGPKGEYFSPDEVRAMSPRQVRKHYETILHSMKHWS